MTALTSSPSLIASLNLFNRSAPAPSPITNPFAPASNGVEWEGDKAPIALNLEKVAGSIVLSVAPQIMVSTCLVCKRRHASITAARDEAQAASIAWFGPCKSRRFATLPATTLANSPGIVSSFILGVPSTRSAMNCSEFSVGNPNFFATLRVCSDQTLMFERFLFSPPNAFANTTPHLDLSNSLPSVPYPASSRTSAATLIAQS